jgi:two-component system, LytTR family, sensor kinase
MVYQYFQAFIQRIRTFVQVNRKTIKAHTIGWSIFWVVDFCFAYANTNGSLDIIQVIKNVFFFTTFFYLVVLKALIPNLPKKIIKAILIFFFILFITILSKYALNVFILKVPSIELSKNGILGYFSFEVWRFSTCSFYALAYWIYLQNIREKNLRIKTEIELRRTQEELLNTEIKFLKAQINPHFLFNTLNFFYAETYKLSPKIGEGIMTLTDILRYTVQSTQNEEISIEKEGEFLHKYVEIQQLRFHETLQVDLKTNIFAPTVRIPPLIILTFVENIFKYGKLNDPTNPVVIRLESDPQKIKFYCKNLKSTHFREPSTTVGIENIRIRLNKHCDNYDLIVTDENNIYTVHLQINL